MNDPNRNQVKSNKKPGALASNSGQAYDDHYSMDDPEPKLCYKGIKIAKKKKPFRLGQSVIYTDRSTERHAKVS